MVGEFMAFSCCCAPFIKARTDGRGRADYIKCAFEFLRIECGDYIVEVNINSIIISEYYCAFFAMPGFGGLSLAQHKSKQCWPQQLEFPVKHFNQAFISEF